MLLSGGGMVGARTLVGPITFRGPLPPVPTHPVPVPKHLPTSQMAISRQQAMTIAETYLRTSGSHGVARSAIVIIRQTFEFDGHATAQDRLPYLWKVTSRHTQAPAPTAGLWANVIVVVGTKDGKVYAVSWNNH